MFIHFFVVLLITTAAFPLSAGRIFTSLDFALRDLSAFCCVTDKLDFLLLLFIRLLVTSYVTADSIAGSNFFSVGSSLEDVSATVLLSVVGENLSPSDKSLASSSPKG